MRQIAPKNKLIKSEKIWTNQNCALLGVGIVKLEHLLEGEGADDIAVEDEEGRVILGKDVLREGQWTSSAKRLSLHRKVNVDVELREHTRKRERERTERR